MAINSVATSTTNSITTTTTSTPSTTTNTTTASVATTKLPEAGVAAVYEKSDQSTSPKTYTRDTATIDEITKQVDMKLSSLRATVENLFNMQTVKSGEAKGLSYDQIMKKYDGKLKDFYQNLKVDDTTRQKAQEDISADGFWGVKQTSQRAIDFAKALAGGDPSKISVLKDSIEKAYQAAEKSWGGQLPEICKQTQEATLKGLDDWAKEANQSTPLTQAIKSTQAS